MGDTYTPSEHSNELQERKRWAFLGLPLTFTKYVLHDNSLTVHSGFFTSVEDDILLYRIMDVTLTRTLLQKAFGLGTLHVVSSDKTMGTLEIRNIKNYRAFKDALSDRVDKERMRMRTRTNEMVGFGDDAGMDDDLDDNTP